MLPFAAFLATGENAVSCVGTMGVSRRFEGCLFRGLRQTPAHRGEQPLGAVNRRVTADGKRFLTIGSSTRHRFSHLPHPSAMDCVRAHQEKDWVLKSDWTTD